jgi:hypothetical protein
VVSLVETHKIEIEEEKTLLKDFSLGMLSREESKAKRIETYIQKNTAF